MLPSLSAAANHDRYLAPGQGLALVAEADRKYPQKTEAIEVDGASNIHCSGTAPEGISGDEDRRRSGVIKSTERRSMITT
jgi:hypothetical protein